MRATEQGIDPQSLLKAIQVIKPVVGTNSAIMVEQNGCLSFTSTDYSAWLNTSIDYQAPNYLVTVPGRRFEQCVKSTGGYIGITVDSETMALESSTGVQSLKAGTEPLSMPELSEDYDSIGVPLSQFRDTVEPTLAAAATDGSRFNLDSILFNGAEKEIIGTDGHRLTKRAGGGVNMWKKWRAYPQQGQISGFKTLRDATAFLLKNGGGSITKYVGREPWGLRWPIYRAYGWIEGQQGPRKGDQ